MPGFLLDAGAVAQCAHGGRAAPAAPSVRVLVSGSPVATQDAPYVVTGCTKAPPEGPDVTAHWITGATRVHVAGNPVLLSDGQAMCLPTATPLAVLVTQVRVRGV